MLKQHVTILLHLINQHWLLDKWYPPGTDSLPIEVSALPSDKNKNGHINISAQDALLQLLSSMSKDFER